MYDISDHLNHLDRRMPWKKSDPSLRHISHDTPRETSGIPMYDGLPLDTLLLELVAGEFESSPLVEQAFIRAARLGYSSITDFLLEWASAFGTAHQ